MDYCTLINILLVLLLLSEQPRFWWNRISSARRRGKILLFNCTHSWWRWRSVTSSRRCCRGGWGTRRKQYVPTVAPAKLGVTWVLHIWWGQWCWSRIYHIKVSASIIFLRDIQIYRHVRYMALSTVTWTGYPIDMWLISLMRIYHSLSKDIPWRFVNFTLRIYSKCSKWWIPYQ